MRTPVIRQLFIGVVDIGAILGPPLSQGGGSLARVNRIVQKRQLVNNYIFIKILSC